MDIIQMNQLHRELYEKNKYVDERTYEENKKRAQTIVYLNGVQDDLAYNYDLGNGVGIENLETAKYIAEWYTQYSFEYIQLKRQQEGLRQRHEELTRTSPKGPEDEDENEDENEWACYYEKLKAIFAEDDLTDKRDG